MTPVPNVIEGIKDTIMQGDGDKYNDLPIADGVVAGDQVRVTRWQPSDEERKLIADGGDVYLYVYGRFHPPVCVTGERPTHEPK